jgi:hypothetical protein
MPDYDRDLYSRNFARLLNRALKNGGGDAGKALEWLDRKYKPLWAVLFSKHRAEMSDAYMDVREHIVKRIKENNGAGGLGSRGEEK